MGCGYEDDKVEFLINTFELKIVSHVCIGKPYTCNVLCPRAHKRDDHYPNCSKLYYGCLLALYGPTSTMYVATLCGQFFFLLSVSHGYLLHTKKKKSLNN